MALGAPATTAAILHSITARYHHPCLLWHIWGEGEGEGGCHHLRGVMDQSIIIDKSPTLPLAVSEETVGADGKHSRVYPLWESVTLPLSDSHSFFSFLIWIPAYGSLTDFCFNPIFSHSPCFVGGLGRAYPRSALASLTSLNLLRVRPLFVNPVDTRPTINIHKSAKSKRPSPRNRLKCISSL